MAPRSQTQRGKPPALFDSEISAVVGVGIPALHRDDYQRDPELLEDQYDYYHQGPPPPLQYVPPSDGSPLKIATRRRKSDQDCDSALDPNNKSQTSLLIEYFEGGKGSQAERRPYDQERREFWAIPTVSSYEDENQEDPHRKNGPNHGVDSDDSNTIRRLTPTQVDAPKSVQQNASDISSITAGSFLDGGACSPERKQNQNLTPGEALAAGAAVGLIDRNVTLRRLTEEEAAAEREARKRDRRQRALAF